MSQECQGKSQRKARETREIKSNLLRKGSPGEVQGTNPEEGLENKSRGRLRPPTEKGLEKIP